jgi:hypothetical protein
MPGFYVANAANILAPEVAAFQDWYMGNVRFAPNDEQSLILNGGQTITSSRTTSFSEMISLRPNTEYTVGLTSTGSSVTSSYVVINADTRQAVLQGSNTKSGRWSATFTTPDVSNLLLTVSASVANGTATLVGASLVYGDQDPGPLNPVYVVTDSSYGAYELRVALYEPNKHWVAALTKADEIQAMMPLSDIGAMKFNYLTSNPYWDKLSATWCEVAVEVSKDGTSWVEVPNGRFIRMEDKNDDAEPETGFELSFVGFGYLMQKMSLMKTDNLNAEQKRPFVNITPGIILRTYILESHEVNVGTGLTFDFSDTLDSNGDPWTYGSLSLYYDMTITMFTALANLVEQGIVEWYIQGRTLRVFNPGSPTISADKSQETIYKTGYEILKAPNRRTNTDIVGRVTVYGEKETAPLVIERPESITPWGHLQTVISQGGVKDEGTKTVLAQNALEKGSEPARELTRTLDWKRARKFPFFDFNLGQYIAEWSADSEAPEAQRVRSVTLTYADQDGVQGNLVLNSRFEESIIKQAKRTNGIANGASLGGTGVPAAPYSPDEDRRVPKAPSGIFVNSVAYVVGTGQDTGQTRAIVTIQWNEVTQATNDTAIDIVEYQVFGRQIETGIPTPEKFRSLATTAPGDESVTLSPYGPGQVWEFKVRAISRASRTNGEFSGTFRHVMAKDATPPKVPTKPILFSRGGAVSITWDGKAVSPTNGSAVTMDLDLNYVEVQVSLLEDFSSDGSTRTLDYLNGPGTIAVSDIAYGSTLYVRFRAIDQSKNISAWSAVASVEAKKLVDTDFTNLILDGANLIDFSVDGTQKLAAGSIDTTRLRVGQANLIVDPTFLNAEITAERMKAIGSNEIARQGFSFISATTTTDGYLAAVDLISARNVWMTTTAGPIANIPVMQGNKYTFTFYYEAVSNAPVVSVIAYLRRTDNTATIMVLGTMPRTEATGFKTFDFVVPVGIALVSVGWNVGNSGTTSDPRVVRFSQIGFRPKIPGVLIENGAVTADKIAANAVSADKISANAVTADSIVAGAIGSIHIRSQAIDGMTITGALIRTSGTLARRIQMNNTEIAQYDANNQRVSAWGQSGFMFRTAVGGGRLELDTSGLRMYNSAGNNTVNFQAATGSTYLGGNITMEGVFKSSTDWPWVEINNALWSNSLFGIRFYGNGGHQGQPEIKVQADGPGQIANGGTLILTSGEVVNTGSGATGHAELRLVTFGDWFLGKVNGSSGAEIRANGGDLRLGTGNAEGSIDMWGYVYLQRRNPGDGIPLVMAGNGGILYQGSVSRLKEDQQPIGTHYEVLDMVPKTWHSAYEKKVDPNVTKRYAGFVAEDLKALSDATGNNLDPLLGYMDGELATLHYERIMAYVIPVMKDMASRISDLENNNSQDA